MKTTNPPRRILCDRDEAAELLGMSLTSFKEHVQPFLPVVRKGRMRRYRYTDLKKWADDNLDHPKQAA